MSNENGQIKQDEKEKGLRLREFEWFEVETKIRSFVFELIEPNMKKLLKDRQKVDGFSDLLNELQGKIKHFDQLFSTNERRIRQFDEATKKINNVITNIGKVQVDLKANGDEIQKMEAANKIQFNLLKGDINQVQIQVESTANSKDDIQKQLDKYKEEIKSSFDYQSNKQQILRDEFKALQTDQGGQQKQVLDQINLIKSLLAQKELSILQNNDNISDLQRKIIQTQNDVKSQSKILDDLLLVQIKVSQNQVQIDKQQQDISTIFEHIDKNIPLNTYTLISECLFELVNSENQKRLIEFDNQQFKILDNRIQKMDTKQMNDKQNSQYSKQEIQDVVDFKENNDFFGDKKEKIIMRNKKYKSITLKKEKIIKQFRNNESTNTQQMSQNSQIDGNNQTNKGQDENALNVDTNTDNQINLDQNHHSQKVSNNRVSSQFLKEGVSPQKEDEENGILSIEQIVAQQLTSPQFNQRLDSEVKKYINQLQTQQQTFINQTKLQFSEMEEQNLLAFGKCQEMVEMEQIKINNLKLNITSTIDAQNESLDTIQQCLSLIQQANLIFESNIFHLNQFCTILTHLIIQDERDKHSIGLFGLRESPIDSNSGNIHSINQQEQFKLPHHNQNSQAVHLDDKCISCSGQSIQINELFKLACLAYKPQPISLEGKYYSRIDLLQFCQKILSNVNLPNQHPKQQGKENQKIQTNDEEDKKVQNTQNHEIQLQTTSRSFNKEPSTHRIRTGHTINQTTEMNYLTNRTQLNTSHQNIDHDINTYNKNESNNYYQIAETNPRLKLKSRELSIKDCSKSLDEKQISNIINADKRQVQLNEVSLVSLSTSQMRLLTQHKVRKLVTNKQNQNLQITPNEQNFNKTSIGFSNTPTNQKISSFEKRRQFIMKKGVSSLNNSTLIN